MAALAVPLVRFAAVPPVPDFAAVPVSVAAFGVPAFVVPDLVAPDLALVGRSVDDAAVAAAFALAGRFGAAGASATTAASAGRAAR